MKGHLRERSPGVWSFVVYLGRGPDGKQRQKSYTLRGGPREIKRQQAKILAELQTFSPLDPSRLTVAEYLTRWLEHVQASTAAKTYEGYAQFVRNHLSPALGHHRLDKLQPLHLQEYYTHALKRGRLDGEGGLSERSVRHHHNVLHRALKQAVQWRLLPLNPADNVEPPVPKRKRMQVLDEEQIGRLLQSTRGTRLYLPVLLAVATGMRRGEILALRWRDVDLRAATLSVVQSLEETKAHGLVFKQPKSAAGEREITLPSYLVEALKRHRGEQAQEQLLRGPKYYTDHGLVVTYADGRPIPPRQLTKDFAKHIRKTDLPPVRFHDLRHSHATACLKDGIPTLVVSERLGHAGAAITLDLYGHVIPSMQRDAARRVDAMLRGVVPPPEERAEGA